MLQAKINLLLVLLCLLCTSAFSQTNRAKYELDVTNYHLTIEPEIKKGYIKGKVAIEFQIDPTVTSISLHAGNLEIDDVEGGSVLGFQKRGNNLIVGLADRKGREDKITVTYHGNPKKGLLFDSDSEHAYTVYFTNYWMVCNDLPGDKATLSMDIIVPNDKECVASGELLKVEKTGDKTLFKWQQSYETPAYTYGFVIGRFNKKSEQQGKVKLNYYSPQLSANKLQKIFQETGNILRFFEEKAGVSYIQSSYSQLLIGNHYQEMSGLAVLRSSYAAAVLKDSSDIHLTSHELAHQWWGNMITCQSFKHFWLNEAFAVYMSTAFSEHRFGKKKYDSDMAIYKGIYDDIVKRGKDKPLVFPNWNNPSRDDRNIVYYKGAYVLHLLRQELGDEQFWKGMKLYSQKYFGKVVVTDDFQQTMELSSQRNLGRFFDKWVHNK